jgi:hypothetical protein
MLGHGALAPLLHVFDGSPIGDAPRTARTLALRMDDSVNGFCSRACDHYCRRQIAVGAGFSVQQDNDDDRVVEGNLDGRHDIPVRTVRRADGRSGVHRRVQRESPARPASLSCASAKPIEGVSARRHRAPGSRPAPVPARDGRQFGIVVRRRTPGQRLAVTDR